MFVSMGYSFETLFCSAAARHGVLDHFIMSLTLANMAFRQMLLMPVESEVAAFSGSAHTGARTAAAALVIQEAYRMFRHRQLVKVSQAILILYLSSLSLCCLVCMAAHRLQQLCQCGLQAKMRWLRTSRLWRNIFQKWTARAREQLALRREAAAVVAMEERRKQYQADAQQRLAWVDEGLAQGILDGSTCPVCCAAAGGLPTSEPICYTVMHACSLFDVASTAKC